MLLDKDIEYQQIEQNNAQTELEKPKKKSWFNVNQFVAGLSLMGTDYNLFVINMALVVLEEENGHQVLFFNYLIAYICY